MTPPSLFALLLLSIAPWCRVSAWIAPLSHSFSRVSPLSVASRDDLEYLPFSSNDRTRLSQMRDRHTAIPIVILDSLVPGQSLEIGSADPKFQKLIQHVFDSPEREVGMIGLNPHTGRPLNLGVTCSLTESKVTLDSQGLWSITVQARRRFEVQGEPWMDESQSFYLAQVEIVDDRQEPLLDHHHRHGLQQQQQVEELSNQIPSLVQEWLGLVLSTGMSNVHDMMGAMKEMGEMPLDATGRAMWVARLVNPVTSTFFPRRVCLEVRPAMLACTNDCHRMTLAVAALQGSIDHLSGKKRLF